MITANWIAKGLREFTLQGYERASQNFKPMDSSFSGSVLITGSNSGIGFAAAEQLASRYATVHLACRNAERAKAAQERLLKKLPSAKVHVHQLDISKLGTIKPFVTELVKTHEINVIVNNAGCMVHGTDKEKRLTSEGYEVNCATNTLGTYMLTQAFLDSAKTSLKKVITVSSGGMYTEKMDPDLGMATNWDKYPKDATALYAKNKRQQVVFMEQLAEQYGDVSFCTMHPGWAETDAVKNAMPDFHRKMEGKWRSPDQGADTITWLTLNKVETGKFWLDRQQAGTHLMFDFSSSSKTNREKLMTNLQTIYKAF